jgi:hypothetical protein
MKKFFFLNYYLSIIFIVLFSKRDIVFIKCSPSFNYLNHGSDWEGLCQTGQE